MKSAKKTNERTIQKIPHVLYEYNAETLFNFEMKKFMVNVPTQTLQEGSIQTHQIFYLKLLLHR